MRACYYYCNKTSLCSTTAPKKKTADAAALQFPIFTFYCTNQWDHLFPFKMKIFSQLLPLSGADCSEMEALCKLWHQRRWREVKKWSTERCVARVAAGGRQLYSPPRACCFLWLNEHQGHFRADVTVHLAAGVAFHRLIIIDNEGPF